MIVMIAVSLRKKSSVIAAIIAIILTLSSDRSDHSDGSDHMETRLKGAAKGGYM